MMFENFAPCILLYGLYKLYNFQLLILYYLTYCNLRKASPRATANSGPIVSRTFPKKAGALTLEKGCPISISARKLFTATSFNPFKRDPPPVKITLLIVRLYFFSYPSKTLLVSENI